MYANVDAAALLERALSAATRSRGARPEEAAKIAEVLAEAHQGLGDFEGVGAALRFARRRVRSDAVERARLMRREAGAGVHFGELDDARRLLTRALVELEGVTSAPALVERAEIASWRGMIALRQGRPGEAVTSASRAVEQAEAADAQMALGRGLIVLDLAFVAQGRVDQATHGTRALAVFDRLGELNQKAMVWNNLGLIAYYQGNWGDALDRYGRAKETWSQTGDRASVVFADFNIGEILNGQGRVDEAEPLLRSALRTGRATGNQAFGVALALLELAKIEMRRGEIESALERLGTCLDTCREAGDSGSVLEVEARIAEAHLFDGKPERAAEHARRVLDEARASEAGVMVLPVLLRVIGQAFLLARQVEEARVALAEASPPPRRPACFGRRSSSTASSGWHGGWVDGDDPEAPRRARLLAGLETLPQPALRR